MEYFSEGRRTGENVIRTLELDTGLTPEIFRPATYSR
jgi:hypothetical protein